MSPPDSAPGTAASIKSGASAGLAPPSLSRATSTSALSVISVESLQTSPRRLLTGTRDRPTSSRSSILGLPTSDPSEPPTSGEVTTPVTPSSSRATSVFGGPPVLPSTRCTPSRKGKERALPEDEQAAGDISGPVGDASQALRKLAMDDPGTRGTAPRRKGVGAASYAAADSPRTRHTRQYFALTDAGKPVFQSHPELNEHSATDLMGVAQTLISIFAEDDDKIRCINRGRHRIAFVLRAPLYLFCVSDWGEPEHILRVHLDYIHLQILSVVTSTQLAKAFQRRSNFDLSRLLEGTENFLHHLIDRAQYDFSFITSTLQPLRMNPVLREAAAASLIPPAKFRDLLYVLLIADGYIVTLLRPKKHSVHPSDLHLLLNMLVSSPALRSTETWIPICLPKFNPAGFVHAYISYVSASLGLVFVSADREAFEELRGWRATVVQNLEKERTLHKIEQQMPNHAYNVAALNCPGLLHFIYKSRQLVQITMPLWSAPYDTDDQDRRRRALPSVTGNS